MSALYHGNKGSIFPIHTHPFTELLLVMNPTGELEVFTHDDNKIIKFGESFKFNREEIHGVKFNEETMILCIWKDYKNDEIISGWKAKILE